MDKKDKIIIIFYVFLAISYTSAILYIDKSFSDIKFPEEVKIIVDEITIVKSADVNKTKIFETMTDIQNYPVILPQNVISVKILNQSSNVIYAEEELTEKFVKIKLITKHTLLPYDKHIIEVMSGDAQGTVVTQTFEETNSTTIITTDVKLNLKGILAPFVYFPKQNVEQYADKTLDKIINYAIGFDDQSKKAIDDLYREILRRPADNQGLQYYGSLLESGKMTIDDIRNALFNSDEAFSIRVDNPTKREIDDLYMQFFGKHADQQTLTYYFDLLQSNKITMEDVRNDLLTKKNG